MTSKSNSELIEIISNNSYVEKAKQAASWELEKRNIEHDYQPPNLSKKDSSKETISSTEEDSDSKKYHENRLLVFGLSCIVGAIYFLAPTIFTNKKSLIPIDGILNNAELIIDNVSSRSRYGYEAKSRRASLYFSLIDVKKSFVIRENIGQKYSHEEYSRIKINLENSDNVRVWINKREIDEIYPKVFRIDIGDRTILSFEEVRNEHIWIFMLLLFLGLGSIVFIFWRKYPDKFNYILNGKPAANNGEHAGPL
jgi:hypothetical protein